MHNWDRHDEGGSVARRCTAERDERDARLVCEHLQIPFTRVNFQPHYWEQVFEPFVDKLHQGATPNPDVTCNRRIKFDVLRRWAMEERGCDYLATGHFARLHRDDGDAEPHLLRTVGNISDQTYFLCTVSAAQLRNVLFPIGGLSKAEVRRLARERYELPDEVCDKKSSVGICFIGKRNFSQFLREYVGEREHGNMVDVDTGSVVAEHEGTCFWTIGQRARVGGSERPYYVCGKVGSDVLVCGGANHAALFADSCLVDDVHMVNGSADEHLLHTDAQLHAVARFRTPAVECTVEKMGDGRYRVRFAQPVRAVTPGQVMAFYRGEVCLGGATIVESGRAN